MREHGGRRDRETSTFDTSAVRAVQTLRSAYGTSKSGARAI